MPVIKNRKHPTVRPRGAVGAHKIPMLRDVLCYRINFHSDTIQNDSSAPLSRCCHQKARWPSSPPQCLALPMSSLVHVRELASHAPGLSLACAAHRMFSLLAMVGVVCLQYTCLGWGSSPPGCLFSLRDHRAFALSVLPGTFFMLPLPSLTSPCLALSLRLS